MSHPVAERSPLGFLRSFAIPDQARPYERRLYQEIYDEALRFSTAWEQRVQGLSEIEREYAETKLAICDGLFDEGRHYDLLLHLIGLVEDAETLSVDGQSDFIRQILFFREHLQDIIVSDAFRAFEEGTGNHESIFEEVERHLRSDLGIVLYKSPEDSLILSFQRELLDVRDDDCSVRAVREFLRDTIANINGIYYVVSMNPDLV